MGDAGVPSASPAVARLLSEGITGIQVMADWSADPVWCIGSPDQHGMLDLDDLDLSPTLVRALRDWRAAWEAALSENDDFDWPSTVAERTWTAQGLVLARRLQQELGDQLQVFYVHGGGRAQEP